MTQDKTHNRRRPERIALDEHIDDLELTPNAMRVYFHLLVLQSSGDAVNIDMEQIGSHCFGSLSKRAATTTKMAEQAMHELRDVGLLNYENDSWSLI